MVKSKTVLLWGREDILISSVEFILAAKDEWQVVSLPNTVGLGALLLAVEKTQADTVIIHQGNHNDPTILPIQLLKDHPALRVITFSLENNAMEVYSKQEICVREASDLISVIENIP
jgi:hypothetical protein